MGEKKLFKLSSSDGSRLTVDQINQAANLLKYSLQRLIEINEGTYRPGQPPAAFDADTSQELLNAVYFASREALKLCDYILHHE